MAKPVAKVPPKSSQTFTFSVDSALLQELGEKLVSSAHIALTELIKNSFDADANEVSVTITFKKTVPHLTITDDGSGMTIEQVRSYWMRIGTTNKKDAVITAKYGRPITGAKGVGRFACRRLGTHLKLTTTAHKAGSKSRLQTTVVEFDWAKFVAGTGVDEIKNKGVVSEATTRKTGTTLEIWGAPVNEWTKAALEYVQRQLGALTAGGAVRRPGHTPDPGFNVLLNTPYFDGRTIDLRNEVMDAGWGTVIAHVDKKGRAHCTLHASGMATQHILSAAKFKSVAGATLRIGIIPLEKKQYRRPEILSKYSAQTIVNEWGGIQVRYNGFRMFPYGEAGDDWLNIEADRARRLGRPSDDQLFKFAAALDGSDAGRSLLNMLSRKNYLGQVEVGAQIAGLEPKIDRQGFLDGLAFNQLREFVRFAVDWANIQRDYYLRKLLIEDVQKARLSVEKILQEDVKSEQLVPRVADYLRKEIEKIVEYLPEDDRKETKTSLFTTLKAIETASTANQRQLEHLRLIASASTLTLLFAHEVHTLIGSLDATGERIKRAVAKVPEKDKSSLSELAKNIGATKHRFEQLIEMTGIVGSFGKQPQLQSIHLKSTVDRAVQCFGLILEKYDIAVESKIPGNFSTGPMIQGEVYTVLINLLSNSIKSVIAAAPKQRRLRFEAAKKDGKTVVRLLDNGLGLAEEHFDDVFRPFISDPAGELYDKLHKSINPHDVHIFGTGSGLGLAIVKDILQARGGSIRFVPPSNDDWKADVEVQFP